VNDRTAISTRIYPPTKRCFGIRFFAEDKAEMDAEPDEQDVDVEMTGTGIDTDTPVKSNIQVNATVITPREPTSDRGGDKQTEDVASVDRTAEPIAELLLAQAWDGLRADMRIVGRG
jgi:hypothetical protein